MTTSSGPHPPGGRLRRRLAAGEFAVTAELTPPRGAHTAPITHAAELLRDWVDAVNVTDNPSANVRLSSLAGSIAVLDTGVEPVMQLTGRDRNRIALQSELLSAGAMGVPNLLLMTGDHPRAGDHPEATPVFDLDGAQLLWTARHLRDQGRLLSGRIVDPPPDWLIGAVDNPFFQPNGASPAARLGRKVAAGAQFIQTQFVFDLAAFARWMAAVRDLGLDRRCHILAGVGPIRSLRALELLRHGLAGVHVPDEVARRLLGVPARLIAEEGMRLCVELIGRLRELPGVAGVHVMTLAHPEEVPEVLARAGIGKRPPPAGATVPAGKDGHRAG